MRLGHIHIKVSDLEKSKEFYKNVFLMEIKEEFENKFVFLSRTEAHHEIALQRLVGGELPPKNTLGMLHIAFEVNTIESFSDMIERLSSRGDSFICVNQGVCWSIYFFDPDGMALECYLDRRNKNGGRKQWNGEQEELLAETIQRLYIREEKYGDKEIPND